MNLAVKHDLHVINGLCYSKGVNHNVSSSALLLDIMQKFTSSVIHTSLQSFLFTQHN